MMELSKRMRESGQWKGLQTKTLLGVVALLSALFVLFGGLSHVAGAADFIIAVDDYSRLYYAESNGDGTFKNYGYIDYLGGGNCRGITINDFNGDGYLDFIAGRGVGDTAYFYLYLNDGSNHFTKTAMVGTLPVANSWSMDMASGDFNNDGRMDFLANGDNYNTGLFINKGNGQFQRTDFNLGGQGRGMDVADFNNDGNLDFARVSYSNGPVMVYPGNGDGTFGTPINLGSVGADPYGLAAGDFDGDGKADIIVNSGGEGNPYFFKGNGDGTFQAAVYVPSLDYDQHGAYDAFDFNGDGKLDMVVVKHSSAKVFYFPGNGDGTFGAGVELGSTSTNPLGISAPPLKPLPGVPVATITPATQTIAKGGTATLNGSGSSDPGGALASWVWTFGDGTTASGTGAAVGSTTHAYASEGIFFPSLKVTDNDGKSSTTAVKVVVQGDVPVVPSAQRIFGESLAVDGQWPITFTGANYASDTEGVVSYLWDLGGGYNETFESGTVPGWKTYGGTWSVSDTNPITGSYSYRQADIVDRPWNILEKRFGSDTVVETDVKFVSGWGQEAQLIFRAQDNQNLYMFILRGRGENDVLFYKRVNGGETSLFEYDLPSGFPGYPITNGTIYHIKVVASGSTFKFYLNDRFLFEWYDTTFATGKVGYSVYYAEALFDNLKVQSVSSGTAPVWTYPAGDYTLNLAATDAAGQTATSAVPLKFQAGNPPVSNAGGPYTAGESAASGGGWTVNLDGSGSSDTESSIARYLWDLGTDTFSGTTVNASKWTVSAAGVTQNDEVSINGTGSWGQRYFFSKDTYKRAKGMTFEAKIWQSAGYAHTMIGFKNTSGSYHYGQLTYSFYFCDGALRIYEDGNDRGIFGGYAKDTWYEVRIELKEGAGARYYLRALGASDWTLIYDTDYSNATDFMRGMDVHSGTFKMDDLREYAAGPKPTYRFYGLGNHPISLTVWDQAFQTNTSNSSVTTAVGNLPVANAGGPYTINESAASGGGWPVNLDGSGSTDDVEIAKYVWDFGVDSFDGAVFREGKWFTNGGITQNNAVSIAGAGGWDNRYMVTKGTFPRSIGQVFQASIKTAGGGESMFGFKNETPSNFHYGQFTYAFYFYYGQIQIYEDGNGRGYTGYNYDYNTAYDFRIELTNTGAVYSYRPTGTTPWIEVYRSAYMPGGAVLRKGGVILNGTWIVDDFLETTAGATPAYTFYKGTGTFDINLTVFDRAGQSNSAIAHVTMNGGQLPVANAGASQNINEAGASNGKWAVQFDASGSSDDKGIYLYEWDWAYNGTQFNPSGDRGATQNHSWSAPGTYTVAVRVWDNALQSSISTTTVTITQGNPPTAHAGGPYTANEDAASEGGWTVSLNGSASTDAESSIARYLWDLGTDPFTGTTVNTGKWVLSAAGVSQDGEIRITGTSSDWGQRYFFSKDNYQRAKGMIFEAKVKQGAGYAHAMVGFKNTGTSYHYNQMTYAFYFCGDDGSVRIYEDGANRGSFGSYARDTWYEVRIELKEGAGARYYFRALGAPDWSLIYDTDYSNATDFKRGADVYAGTFVMDDLREYAAGPTPTYRFYGLGSHPISLTVWDQALQTNTDSTTVTTTAGNPPVANAGSDKTGNESNAFEGVWTFEFNASGSTDDRGIFRYEWDFNGDGIFDAVGLKVTHAFTMPGVYTETLRVTDNALQTAVDDVKVTIAVGSAPVAEAGNDMTTEGRWPVRFNGGGSSDDVGIYKYVWDFGDGAGMTGKTPTHSYIQPGDYTVTLKVYDSALQMGQDTLTVHVLPSANPPVANAGGPYTAGVGGAPVYFNGGLSSDDYGIVKYLWDVDDKVDSDGDGNFTNDIDVVGKRPFYTYSAPGIYNVTLKVVDGAGQTATATTTVTVTDNVPPNVICVPWRSGDPRTPHETYNGRDITLKGIVRGAGPFTYQWNFGDGSALYPASPASVANPRIIEATHTYPDSPDGTPYIATLTVWDKNGHSGTDQYYVIVRPNNLDTRTNIAIDEGLWWLHKNQANDGYWVYDSQWGYFAASPTASAVQAFEINGHLQDGDNEENPYVETVNKGMRYLFTTLTAYSIGAQRFGNPDTNGNGIGISVNSNRPIYEGGMVMDAIASSNAPLGFATTGGDHIKGRFYYDILTDMVDMYAHGQDDYDAGGGWRYGWKDWPDNSACQWAAIGMLAAKDNFGINAPQWVKDRNNNWLNTSYNGTGFGYDGAGNGDATTPSGMVQLAFVGKYTSDPRWRTAEDYIASHWFWQGTNYYGVYSMTKALRLAKPFPVVNLSATSLDWYNDPTTGVRRRLTDQQDLSVSYRGSWQGSGYENRPLDTAWAVIMLTPTLFVQAPVANAGSDILWAFDTPLPFDAKGSYHTDPEKKIVKYEWDFDGDGSWDFTTTNPSDPNAVYTYPDPHPEASGDLPVSYNAKLRVTDNNEPPQTNIAIRVVTVAEPPHPPFAMHGGPYTATAGLPFTLNAGRSYDLDPGDGITLYQWDMDNDGVWFDNTEIETVSPAATYTYPQAGVYSIGLRVWDKGVFHPLGCTPGVSVDSGGCQPLVSNPVFTTVTVAANVAPTANAGGPYTINEGSPLTLDGSGSSDPNGDQLTYAWDLNGDGNFDDSSAVKPQYTWPQNGTYTVKLRVSDGLLSSEASATVTVLNVTPVVTAGQNQNVVAGSTVSFQGGFTDPGTQDTQTYQWDFGDGSPVVTGVLNPTHVYKRGTYTATLTVTDSDGAKGTSTVTVVAANTAPIANAGGPYNAKEGTPLTLDGSGSYDPNGDQITYAWDLNGDGIFNDSTAAKPQYTWAQNGTYMVRLRVSDGLLSSETSTVVTVANMPPVVTAGPNQNAFVGASVAFHGSFTDPGTQDTHTIQWDFGDGSPKASGSLDATHPYSRHGNYTATLTVTDNDGAAGHNSLHVLVCKPSSDKDCDGMNDEWEIRRFGNVTNSDGTGDFDQNGINDLQDYLNSIPKGDVDENGLVELKDAILVLKMLAGDYSGEVYAGPADVNGDGNIGLPEVLYIFEVLGGLR